MGSSCWAKNFVVPTSDMWRGTRTHTHHTDTHTHIFENHIWHTNGCCTKAVSSPAYRFCSYHFYTFWILLAACLTCFMFNDPTLHSSCNKVILSRVLSRYMNLAHALLWCVSAQAIQYPYHPQYVSRRNRRKHCKV